MCWPLPDKAYLRHHHDKCYWYLTLQTNSQTHTVMLFWGCTRVHVGTMHTDTREHVEIQHKSHKTQPAASLAPRRRSFKLWYDYTLKASLRRYSSLAISSATQPGISGMATWMMYFRRIAKCCKPPRPQRDRLNTQLHQGTTTLCPCRCFTQDRTAHLKQTGFCILWWVKNWTLKVYKVTTKQHSMHFCSLIFALNRYHIRNETKFS